MTKTYADVMKQIEALQQEAERLKSKERQGVIARIKEAIDAYGLTESELGLRNGRTGKSKPTAKAMKAKPGKHKAAPVAKFRDEAGNTWVGRGPRPQWLRDALASGKELKDFAV